jgi:purine-nucleoside phosphorylase
LRDVEQIYFLGTVGALTNVDAAIAIGDLILPRGGISEESCSALYHSPLRFTRSPSEHQTSFESILNSAARSQPTIKIHEGIIWTTDAPHLETEEKIQHYREQNAIAVDMEYTALANITAIRNIALCACFAVSDITLPMARSGFKSKELSSALAIAADALLKTAQHN